MPAAPPRQKPPVAPAPPPSGFATGQGASAAAGAAVAAPGTALAVGASSAAIAGGAALAQTIDEAVDALRRFWTRVRLQNEAWLRATMIGKAPPDDVAQAAAEENEREAAFQLKAQDRFKRAMAAALGEPDLKRRNARVTSALAAERRYAVMRQSEMARRSVAAVDRAALRRESPQGGFWKLDLTKKTHTAECVAMAGKLWPWEALDRYHFWPPLGGGCGCSLYSYKTAVGSGWLRAGKVPDVEDAMRAVSRLTNLHEEDGRYVELAQIRFALEQAGAMTPEHFDGAIKRLVEEELWKRAS